MSLAIEDKPANSEIRLDRGEVKKICQDFFKTLAEQLEAMINVGYFDSREDAMRRVAWARLIEKNLEEDRPTPLTVESIRESLQPAKLINDWQIHEILGEEDAKEYFARVSEAARVIEETP